jgi:hypothetical protein
VVVISDFTTGPPMPPQNKPSYPAVRAMPPDIAVSIEVPTAELARTVDAKARAQRALGAARKAIAAARSRPLSPVLIESEPGLLS